MAFNTVDTSGFDNAIVAFHSALDAYRDARNLLNNRTTTLASHWEGSGGDKFRDVTGKIMKLLEDDGESLNYIIQNLEEIRRTYKEADQKIANKIENNA